LAISVGTDKFSNPSLNLISNVIHLILIHVFPCTDTLQFIPLEHEPRIYLAAPSGVPVTRVTAVDRLYPESVIRYSLDPAKSDSRFFQIHGESGNITTKR
jgi:hypothetical protein